MTTNIRTAWHKILPLIESGNVVVTAPQGKPGLPGEAQWYEDLGGDLATLKKFIQDVSTMPLFVIERELINLAGTNDYQRSLYDMKRGKVLRLPYPAMIVEFHSDKDEFDRPRNYTTFVIVRDLYAGVMSYPWEQWSDSQVEPGEPLKVVSSDGVTLDDDKMDFYGVRMSIERDGDGFYLSVSPSIVYGAIEQKDGDPWLRFGGFGSGLLPATEAVEKVVMETYMKDAGAVFYGVSAAYLLMKTQGVDAETVDTRKINRTRTGKPSQPYIPQHTYIKIGRVYRNLKSETTDEYVPRKSPRPHWRRGHLRNVRFGPGRVNIKEKYIYPKLVALKSDSVVPPPTHDYKVTK